MAEIKTLTPVPPGEWYIQTDDHLLPVIALAKEEEEVFIPGHTTSLKLPMDSSGLLLLRHVRDEAHRFAIAFHRKRRSKESFS